MKHVRKHSALIVLGAVLLATLHSHVREHQVPHPSVVKVSVAKRVLARPQLPVVPAVAAVSAAKHLIVIGLVPTPGTVALPEIKRTSCRLRGPPGQTCRSAA